MYTDPDGNHILTEEEFFACFSRAEKVIEKNWENSWVESWETTGKWRTKDFTLYEYDGKLYTDEFGQVEIFTPPQMGLNCECGYKEVFEYEKGHFEPGNIYETVSINNIETPKYYAPILHNQDPLDGFEKMPERNPKADIKVLWCLERGLFARREYKEKGYVMAHFFCPICGMMLVAECKHNLDTVL